MEKMYSNCNRDCNFDFELTFYTFELLRFEALYCLFIHKLNYYEFMSSCHFSQPLPLDMMTRSGTV